MLAINQIITSPFLETQDNFTHWHCSLVQASLLLLLLTFCQPETFLFNSTSDWLDGVLGWQWHQLDDMHFAPDRQSHQHLITQYFTGRVLFLMPNQQCQSTEGTSTAYTSIYWSSTYIHTFNGPFSRTTQVSRYQKGKTNLDFTEATDSEWQWHQLGHMQVCTSLQTENHASTPPLSFLQAGCPSCRPTNSVKALKVIKYSN